MVDSTKTGRLTVSFLPPDMMSDEQLANAQEISRNMPGGGWLGRGPRRSFLPAGMNPEAAYQNPVSDYIQGNNTPSSHSPYADPFNGWIWQNINQGKSPTPSGAVTPAAGGGVSQPSRAGRGMATGPSRAAAPFMQTFAGPRGRR
jgi:hypothetical protein